jgi:hypothetical protein
VGSYNVSHIRMVNTSMGHLNFIGPDQQVGGFSLDIVLCCSNIRRQR